jgi:polysaccharide export outer membrane protein
MTIAERRRARTAAAASLLLLALAAPAAAQNGGGYMPTPASAAPYVPEPPLSPGDMVRLHFWQEPQFSGDFPVDERGIATLPLLGPRQMTQWPADQVKAQLIREFARQLRDQPAQITMLRRVAIIGAVQDPGLYHVDPTMRVGDVLALAGGPTPDARLNRAVVLRQGRVIQNRIDNTVLLRNFRSGDQIMVPQRPWIERNAAIVIGAGLSVVAIIVRGY